MEEIKSSFASALLDSSSNMSSASLLSLPTLSTSLLANRQEKNRLISSFQSKNTKERAKAIKAKSSSIQTPAVLKALPASVSVVDSIYQSVRFMPKKLTYDYQRRLVRQLGNNLDSDSKQGRIRLLPSDISTSDATAGKVKKGTKQLEIGDVPLFVGMSSGAVDSFDDIDFEEVELDSEALEEQASSIPQDPELINVLMDYTMFISNLDELKFLQDVVNSTLSVIDVGESNEDLQVLLTIVEDWKTFTLAMLSRVESEPSTAERQPFVFVNVTDVAAASKGLVEVINRLEANNQIVDVRLDDALDLLRVLKTSLEGSMGKDVKVKREVGDDVEVMLSADKEVVDGKPSDSPKASTTQQILAFSPIFQNYSFVSSTMWSSVNGNSSSDSGMASTVEVSAVKVEASKESQLIATLVSALDVILFLLETLVKAVVPLFLDKGQTAMERIADTMEGSSWFGMNNYLRVKRWQGYSTLKNFK